MGAQDLSYKTIDPSPEKYTYTKKIRSQPQGVQESPEAHSWLLEVHRLPK